MRGASAIVWFGLDLRLADNPALDAAVRRGGPVVPVFIWAPEEEGAWPPGAASRWWLHQSLTALDASLRKAGSALVVRRGPSSSTLLDLVRESGASAVFWNRRYEPALMARDAKVVAVLSASGIQTESFSASLLYEPSTVKNQSGRPFQVFSAFWRACLAQPEPTAPLRAPRRIPGPVKALASVPLRALELEPRIDWAGGLRAAWTPGAAGARLALTSFLSSGYADYSEGRERPAVAGTSRLSPHLHFGEISAREVWHAVREHTANLERGLPQTGRGTFLSEVGWREFAHHLLHHFPHTSEQPLRPEFARFPWRENKEWLGAWTRGRTGYPLVDAGLRELWSTGWMHNRVRMVAASFLVKNLLIPWQTGARWFWDTLVDADLANNTLGWQWTAGCGADAAPYFRIFNPVAQGEKFDPQAEYIRRWVPELARLPDRYIHKPWLTPASLLAQAGIQIGRTYPEPVVSLFSSRQAALTAFAQLKTRSTLTFGG